MRIIDQNHCFRQKNKQLHKTVLCKTPVLSKKPIFYIFFWFPEILGTSKIFFNPSFGFGTTEQDS